MSKRTTLVASLFVLSACSPPSRGPADVPATAAALAPPRTLDSDVTASTPSGGTFEAPKGWTLTETRTGAVLVGPENDVRVSVVEIHGQVDGAAAIAAAWNTISAKGAPWPVQQVVPVPAKDGWDAIVQVTYDSPAHAHRHVLAVAQRKGDLQFVFLVDAAAAGLDRRGAQVGTILSTFKAKGVKQESFAGKPAHDLDAARLALLDAFMQHALDVARVPGAALAVVQHGKLVFERGYGVTTVAGNDPVRPDTLFLIGSTTKSLTTLLMAQLVDERKLAWDRPVQDVLPAFRLADPGVTAKVLVRHTVCACTGMPRRDLDLFFGVQQATPESRLALMKTFTPTTGFGETFQYSNLMVSAGGFAAAHAALPQLALGPAYDQAMRTHVFEPLGMKRTTFDFAVAEKAAHASPHAADLHGVYHTLSLHAEEGVVAVRPAGGAWSSVQDMSRYVAFELAKGVNDRGQRVVSEQNLLARRAPRTKITDKMSYGYGLFVENAHGVTVVGHGGNNLGFTTDLFFLPGHDVGLVVLQNGDSFANPVRGALRRRLLEILFDGEPLAEQKLRTNVAAQREGLEKELGKLVATPPGFAERVVGTYDSAELGVLIVQKAGDDFLVDARDWKSAARVRKEDDGALALELVDPPFAGLVLLPTAGGGLSLDMPQQKYEFARR